MRLDGERVSIRPPLSRDWHEWSDLRERSRAFLTPWEPTWPADALARTAYLRRLRRQIIEWRDDEAYSFLAVDRRTDRVVRRYRPQQHPARCRANRHARVLGR